jgi:hypothetical protein
MKKENIFYEGLSYCPSWYSFFIKVWFYGALRHFQQYFSYILAASFIVGGNQSTQRKPPTCRKSLTNFVS